MPVASGVAKVFFLFVNQTLFCLLTVSDPSLPVLFISSCLHTWAPPCSLPACHWSSPPALSWRRMGFEQAAAHQMSFHSESVFRRVMRTQLKNKITYTCSNCLYQILDIRITVRNCTLLQSQEQRLTWQDFEVVSATPDSQPHPSHLSISLSNSWSSKWTFSKRFLHQNSVWVLLFSPACTLTT